MIEVLKVKDGFVLKFPPVGVSGELYQLLKGPTKTRWLMERYAETDQIACHVSVDAGTLHGRRIFADPYMGPPPEAFNQGLPLSRSSTKPDTELGVTNDRATYP